MATLDDGAPSDSYQFSAASSAVQRGDSSEALEVVGIAAAHDIVSISATRMKGVGARRMGGTTPRPFLIVDARRASNNSQ